MKLVSNLNFFLAGVFVASLSALVLDNIIFFLINFFLFAYFLVVLALYFKNRKTSNLPKLKLKLKNTKEHKELIKIKKKRLIEAEKKHDIINNQSAYIAEAWKLSIQQEKTFITFIKTRAYSELFSKMTASLLPQLIKMIDKCLESKKAGCKREISRRINELVEIMKEEIRRKKSKKVEDFETTKEVYDHLIGELK
jgi:hypothetical protein